jgi:hypothetical protein
MVATPSPPHATFSPLIETPTFRLHVSPNDNRAFPHVWDDFSHVWFGRGPVCPELSSKGFPSSASKLGTRDIHTTLSPPTAPLRFGTGKQMNS